MIPAGSQSIEFAPTAIILLSARTQDVAIPQSPSLGAEAIDLRTQRNREKVSITPEREEDAKNFL